MRTRTQQTRIPSAASWQPAVPLLPQNRGIFSNNRRLGRVGLLLLLFAAATFALPAPAQQKVVVRPAVLPATLLRMDNNANFVLFQARHRRWKRNVSQSVLLKAGKRVPATSFHPGEQIVLLSTFNNFEFIDTVADRLSYAAFYHDRCFVGTLQDWRPGHSLMLSGTNVYRGREKPQTPSRFNEDHFLTAPRTQFWLHGEKMPLARARKYLVAGTTVFVAIRWRDASKINGYRAHAVFDWQTWQAYAQSELKIANDLFLPRTPQYRRTKD